MIQCQTRSLVLSRQRQFKTARIMRCVRFLVVICANPGAPGAPPAGAPAVAPAAAPAAAPGAAPTNPPQTVEEARKAQQQLLKERAESSNAGYAYLLVQSAGGYNVSSEISVTAKSDFGGKTGTVTEKYIVDNQFKSSTEALPSLEIGQKMFDQTPIIKDGKPLTVANVNALVLQKFKQSTQSTWGLYFFKNLNRPTAAKLSNDGKMQNMFALMGQGAGGFNPWLMLADNKEKKDWDPMDIYAATAGGGNNGWMVAAMKDQKGKELEKCFAEATAAMNAANATNLFRTQNQALKKLGIRRVGVSFANKHVRTWIKSVDEEPPAVLRDILDPGAVLISARRLMVKAGVIHYYEKKEDAKFHDADGNLLYEDKLYNQPIGYTTADSGRRTVFEYWRVPRQYAAAALQCAGDQPTAVFEPFVDLQAAGSLKANVIWDAGSPRAWFTVNWLVAPTMSQATWGAKRADYSKTQTSSVIDMQLFPKDSQEARDLSTKGYTATPLKVRNADFSGVKLQLWTARPLMFGNGSIYVEVIIPPVSGYTTDEFALYTKRTDDTAWRAYQSVNCQVQYKLYDMLEMQAMFAREGAERG